MIPARSPTSQNGPCSLAKRTAVTINANVVYVPSGTRSKFESLSQRGSQPRQKISSRIGTRITARAMRSHITSGSASSVGLIETFRCPVIPFWKIHESRQPGISASGATQRMNTAMPTAMESIHWGKRKDATRSRDVSAIVAATTTTHAIDSQGCGMASNGTTARHVRKTANGAIYWTAGNLRMIIQIVAGSNGRFAQLTIFFIAVGCRSGYPAVPPSSARQQHQSERDYEHEALENHRC